MRTGILLIALTFTVLLGAATISVISSSGFDVLTALSLLVIALFSFGIVGALIRPPE